VQEYKENDADGIDDRDVDAKKDKEKEERPEKCNGCIATTNLPSTFEDVKKTEGKKPVEENI